MRIYKQPVPASRKSQRRSPGNRTFIYGGTASSEMNVRVATGLSGLLIKSGEVKQNFERVSVTQRPNSMDEPVTSKPSTAHEWIRANESKLRRFAGNWVAVTRNGVIADSDDFDGVFAKAKQRGVTNPLVFKVPGKDGQLKVVSARII